MLALNRTTRNLIFSCIQKREFAGSLSPSPHRPSLLFLLSHGISSSTLRPEPLPRGHQPGKHSPDLPWPHGPRSNPRPRCSRCGTDWKSELWLLGVAMAAMATFVIVVWYLAFFIGVLAGPGYPALRVAGLTVSNSTVMASAGATWEAALLAQKPEHFGNLFFHKVHCFLYYQGDAEQPLALALAKPFVLRSTDRTVIKAKIRMERLAKAVVENMHRECRSVGTVAVGLELRMQGIYVLGSWWKKNYGLIEARCGHLRIALTNSCGEGSLVTGNNLATLPSDNLASCSYNGYDYSW
ncbi:hypothetical protein ACJRO7_007706 [Eucalyptus globulus]|uniref:Late embryogenesis abundant protein LEA-2 subgroup domain-containing protein n=1 Tax=Eucalyptus globulus TaxID=34317 RepID=A0ABD3INW2_EUCGL